MMSDMIFTNNYFDGFTYSKEPIIDGLSRYLILTKVKGNKEHRLRVIQISSTGFSLPEYSIANIGWFGIRYNRTYIGSSIMQENKSFLIGTILEMKKTHELAAAKELLKMEV